MCESCGCGTPDAHDTAPGKVAPLVLDVGQRLLADNDARARHNREHFDAHGVLCLNLMSSPGAGKTRLIEATIAGLAGRLRLAVIEGDLATENDATRVRALGVQAVQITTGNACHLDAAMVHDALHALPLAGLDLLVIENVGNLVCPAAFDLGQHANVVLLSATEGDDKPEKYPAMFRAADLVVLTKADLLPYLEDFRPERAEASLRRVASPAPVLSLSAKSGQGLEAWLAWLRASRARAAPVAALERTP